MCNGFFVEDGPVVQRTAIQHNVSRIEPRMMQDGEKDHDGENMRDDKSRIDSANINEKVVVNGSVRGQDEGINEIRVLIESINITDPY